MNDGSARSQPGLFRSQSRHSRRGDFSRPNSSSASTQRLHQGNYRSSPTAQHYQYFNLEGFYNQEGFHNRAGFFNPDDLVPSIEGAHNYPQHGIPIDNGPATCSQNNVDQYMTSYNDSSLQIPTPAHQMNDLQYQSDPGLLSNTYGQNNSSHQQPSMLQWHNMQSLRRHVTSTLTDEEVQMIMDLRAREDEYNLGLHQAKRSRY